MGACGSNQYVEKNQMSNRSHADAEGWATVKRASFEAPDFKYVKEIQDVYTNTYGGYLMPIQMAGLILEFKRYLFIVAQQCKAEMNVRAAPEDVSGRMKLVTPTKLNPSPIVDRLWRMLIINTRLYEEFCIRNFGGVLDRDSSKLSSIDGYNSTLTKLRESFTYFDKEVWPPYTRSGELQDANDGFLWIVLQDFLNFHLDFKKLSTQGTLTQQKQEEELNRLRNKHLRRHPDQVRPQDNRFNIGEPFRAAANYVGEGVKKIAEPLVSAAPKDDDDDSGDNDFFDNLKAGIDFEDPPPKRIHVDGGLEAGDRVHVQGKIVANTGVPLQKPTNRRIETARLQDDDDDEVDPDFMSDDEDEEDVKEEESDHKAPEAAVMEGMDQGARFVVEETKEQVVEKYERAEEQVMERKPPTPEKEDRAKPPALTPVVPQTSNVRPELIDGLSADWIEIKKKNDEVLNYKIPGIVERTFQREINTTVLLCDDIFTEYKKFHLLKQVVRSDVKLVPSHYVKLAWEYHLIETAHYRRFCFDCFGHFVHSTQHLPRKVDDMQKFNYQNTLRLYRHVFEQEPPQYIWPPVDERFNYNKLYNNKYIHLSAYIQDMMSKVKKAPASPLENERSYRERAQALGSMSASYMPERGSQFIIIKQEGDLQPRGGPMPITTPQKRDPGAEYYKPKPAQMAEMREDNRYIKDNRTPGAFDDELEIREQAKANAQARLDKEAKEGIQAGVTVQANRA